MKVEKICKDLFNNIQRKEFKGIVHSVFPNSFNLLDGNKNLITILNPGRALAPNSMRLKEYISFKDLDIPLNSQVFFTRNYGEIWGTNLRLYYTESDLWNKAPNLNFKKDSPSQVKLKLEKMGEFLLKRGKKLGIYPLIKVLEEIKGVNLVIDKSLDFGPNEEFMKNRFLKFIQAYKEENLLELGGSAKNIIGYGIGLTPSMDDFISGIMISRLYLSHYLEKDMEDVYKINQAIIKEMKDRTTVVSEEMLKFTALGEVNEYMKDLIISYLGDFPMGEFEKNLNRIINIGETSGTDMLLGLYVGSCILLYS